MTIAFFIILIDFHVIDDAKVGQKVKNGKKKSIFFCILLTYLYLCTPKLRV